MTGNDSPSGSGVFDFERARRIRRNYGAWAPVYDRFARATASIGGVRAGCVAALDLEPGDTVVDAGCGPGVNLPALREAVGPEGHVVGVDITRPMLHRARRLIERRGWENVSLVQGDVTHVPIAAADGILATFVTSLFSDPYPVVHQWCEVADSVVVTNFAPNGGRVANAALRAFARLNARLFDIQGTDFCARLDERTAESRRALEDGMDTITSSDYVFGTIQLNAGHRK